MVVSEHKLSREEWEEKIAKFHAKHHGMSRAEAMMEYLKVMMEYLKVIMMEYLKVMMEYLKVTMMEYLKVTVWTL